MQQGLSDTKRKEFCEKYPLAENCSMISAQTLNPELKNIIGLIGNRKDQYQTTTQNQLGAGLSALGKLITSLLNFQ